jgi:hypothetical protein
MGQHLPPICAMLRRDGHDARASVGTKVEQMMDAR